MLQIGRTPLHRAAHNGHTGVVKIVTSFGAKVDVIDNVSYNNNVV